MLNRKKIFINHSEEDMEIARKLYSDLKNNGYFPWLETEDFFPGQNRTMIYKIIQESSYFIVLLSTNSLKNIGNFHSNNNIAFKIFKTFPPDKIFIIPVSIDKCSSMVNQELSDLVWANMSISYDDGLNQILRVLKKEKSNLNVDDLKQILHVNSEKLNAEFINSNELIILYSILTGFILGCLFLLFNMIGAK